MELDNMFPVWGGAGAAEGKPPNGLNTLDGGGAGVAEPKPLNVPPNVPPNGKLELPKTVVLVALGFDVEIAAVELGVHEPGPTTEICLLMNC
jgi:hypothetical protein